MTLNRKPPTTIETLKNIQQTRIAYGADERARYVEHVCGLLLNDRFWPGAADDMFTIEDHEADGSFIDLLERLEGKHPCLPEAHRFNEHSHPTDWQARVLALQSPVRTGNHSDRATAPHVQLLGHLNQANAPPLIFDLRSLKIWDAIRCQLRVPALAGLFAWQAN